MKKQKKENTNYKTYLKKNQGITLIALVVTIVVLIILALISINAVFGKNGIIQSSHDARLVSEQGTVLEDLRMEIYGKISNPEYTELGGLQYLKEQTGTEIEKKVREDNTINVEQVREGIKSGRGSLDTGDVYYIEGTDLFYLDKEKKTKNLGQIFNDTESLNANLEIKKEVTSTPENGERYAVGEVVKYKITVKNIGTKTINNIKVEDTLKAIDIVTKEETVRLQQTFETLYDAAGNEIGNSLDAGKTGYVTYTYTVVKEDLGKELSNKATVKGKNAIPKGEKPVVTPVGLPRGSVAFKKTVIQPNREYEAKTGTIKGDEMFEFCLWHVVRRPDNLEDYYYKEWDESKLSLLLPEGRDYQLGSNSSTTDRQYAIVKLKHDEILTISGLNER